MLISSPYQDNQLVVNNNKFVIITIKLLLFTTNWKLHYIFIELQWRKISDVDLHKEIPKSRKFSKIKSVFICTLYRPLREILYSQIPSFLFV